MKGTEQEDGDVILISRAREGFLV